MVLMFLIVSVLACRLPFLLYCLSLLFSAICYLLALSLSFFCLFSFFCIFFLVFIKINTFTSFFKAHCFKIDGLC